MTDGVKRALERISSSIVSTPLEVERAQALREQADSSEGNLRQSAIDDLLALEGSIALREQGRESTLIPTDPALAGPVLSGLERFAIQVGEQLELQISDVERARAHWLRVSISSLVLAILIPLSILLWMSRAGGVLEAGSIAALGGLAMACAVMLGLVGFRVFQVSDETVRRLKEKRVSLAFLRAAVDLNASAPGAATVLERSFDMFLTHYEGAHSPVTVSDVWPTLPSKGS